MNRELPPPTDRPTLPDGSRVDLVGESFYGNAYAELFGRSDRWRRFDGPIAELVPAPRNEHDRRAVAVKIGGKKIGHLSRADAHARRFRATSDEAIAEHGRATARADVRCAPSSSSSHAANYGTFLWISNRHPAPVSAAAEVSRHPNGSMTASERPATVGFRAPSTAAERVERYRQAKRCRRNKKLRENAKGIAGVIVVMLAVYGATAIASEIGTAQCAKIAHR